ncbi:MAG TPA: amidohydrolase family protein [Terriglobales bacterium]|nr:amidohydrolase family protein [Terriglobales bacterium]
MSARQILWVAVVLFSALAVAQTATLSKEVQQFVSVTAPKIVLTHVRVIDGTGAPAVDDQNVVIENGKITAIEKGGDVGESQGTRVLDLRGHTVMPGIVGMHNHLYYVARPNLDSQRHYDQPVLVPEMAFSSPRLYLAGGVTTMRTTGCVEPYTDLNLKQDIDAGKLPGPHIDVTAPYLEGPGSHFIQMMRLTGPDDARQNVDFWANRGATSFKAYMNITRAELKAAIDEAHKRGLKLTGHLCSVTYKEAAELGIDDLEHGFFVNTELDPGKKPDVCSEDQGNATLAQMEPNSAEAKDLIQTLIQYHVAVTSTLPVFEEYGKGLSPVRQQMLDAMMPQAREDYFLARQPRTKPPKIDPALLWKHELGLEYEFAKAGGLLLSGPDPTGAGDVVPGFGDQRGIELLAEAGFTPVEAIRIATLNGAIFLGRDQQIGSIAAGKDADLVVIKGDPSQKIGDVENVEIVFKDGVGYDSQKLLESVRGRYGQY